MINWILVDKIWWWVELRFNLEYWVIGPSFAKQGNQWYIGVSLGPFRLSYYREKDTENLIGPE